MFKKESMDVILKDKNEILVVHPKTDEGYLVSRHALVDHYSYPNGGSLGDEEITRVFEPAGLYMLSKIQLLKLKSMVAKADKEGKIDESLWKKTLKGEGTTLYEKFVSDKETKDKYGSILQKDFEIALEKRNKQFEKQENKSTQKINKFSAIISRLKSRD